MTHLVENNPDSQQHLDENLDKFKGDMKIVMQLLYSGKRLSAQGLVKDYGIADRRLRDAIAVRPEVIKKEWKRDKNGKRLYVEYFIPIDFLPSKKKALEVGQKLLDKMKSQTVNSLFQ